MTVFRVSLHETVEVSRSSGFNIEAPNEAAAHARATAYMLTSEWAHDTKVHEQPIDGSGWRITSVHEAASGIDLISVPSEGGVLVTESDWAKIQAEVAR